jgi:hypothetical protein
MNTKAACVLVAGEHGHTSWCREGNKQQLVQQQQQQQTLVLAAVRREAQQQQQQQQRSEQPSEGLKQQSATLRMAIWNCFWTVAVAVEEASCKASASITATIIGRDPHLWVEHTAGWPLAVAAMAVATVLITTAGHAA